MTRASSISLVVSEHAKKVEQMKKWASQPWETNLVHVNGMTALEADNGLWVQKALTLLCRRANSLQLGGVKDMSAGHMHFKGQGFCGGRGSLLSTEEDDAEACAFIAHGGQVQSFILRILFRRGYCNAGELTFDEAQYETWEGERANLLCVDDGWAARHDFCVLVPSREDSVSLRTDIPNNEYHGSWSICRDPVTRIKIA